MPDVSVADLKGKPSKLFFLLTALKTCLFIIVEATPATNPGNKIDISSPPI